MSGRREPIDAPRAARLATQHRPMPRVMILIDSYRVSGPAKGLLDFCEATHGRCGPLLVAFERRRRGPTELRDACERRGIDLRVVRERFRYDPAMFGQTVRLARGMRPDLLQTHGYKADIVGLALGALLRLPWVAFSHGRTDEGLKTRMYHALDDLIIRRADRVVAVSEARRAALVAAGGASARVVTIPNAVDTPPPEFVDAHEARRELRLDPDRPLVAVIGRLSPEKGHADFLRSLALVARAVTGVQAIIVGDGQEETRLRMLADTLRLGDSVRFLGYRRDMSLVYRALDLLVLPSLSEGLPNVVLEAMAHGRAVVATRVGGVPEAVDDGVTGVLVPPGDVAALAGGVVRLLGHPELRESMGRAARTRVERCFSVGARAERVLSLYAELLEGVDAGRASGARMSATGGAR